MESKTDTRLPSSALRTVPAAAAVAAPAAAAFFSVSACLGSMPASLFLAATAAPRPCEAAVDLAASSLPNTDTFSLLSCLNTRDPAAAVAAAAAAAFFSVSTFLGSMPASLFLAATAAPRPMAAAVFLLPKTDRFLSSPGGSSFFFLSAGEPGMVGMVALASSPSLSSGMLPVISDVPDMDWGSSLSSGLVGMVPAMRDVELMLTGISSSSSASRPGVVGMVPEMRDVELMLTGRSSAVSSSIRPNAGGELSAPRAATAESSVSDEAVGRISRSDSDSDALPPEAPRLGEEKGLPRPKGMTTKLWLTIYVCTSCQCN